jgi:hypothetical protein
MPSCDAGGRAHDRCDVLTWRYTGRYETEQPPGRKASDLSIVLADATWR